MSDDLRREIAGMFDDFSRMPDLDRNGGRRSEPLRVPALPGRNCCGRCRHFRCDIQTADGTPLAEFGCCTHPASIAQDPLLMVDDWCSLFAARGAEEVRHE